MTDHTTSTTRRMTTLAIVASSALALAACGDGAGDDADSDGTAQAATLVLEWTPNTNHSGIYVAEAEGYYDDAGIDVEIIQPGEGGSLQAIGTGNAEFAISVQESLIPARAAGVPAVSIAAIIEQNTSSLIGLAETGLATPSDLEGLRYGGFGGQLERQLIETLVECDGGDPSTVDIVEVGNTDYRVGLENGDFDVVWVFDGWDKIRLEQAGVAVSTLPFADHAECIPNWYTPLLATSESLIAENPDLVADFVAATVLGYQTAIDDPSLAADHLLAAAPELDEQLVRESAAFLAERFTTDPDSWGQQNADTWAAFAAFLTDAGLVDGEVDIDAAYTNEFLPRG